MNDHETSALTTANIRLRADLAVAVRERDEAHAWMRRIKAMLNRGDMIGVFAHAALRGIVLSQDTKREVEEVWAEYAVLDRVTGGANG